MSADGKNNGRENFYKCLRNKCFPTASDTKQIGRIALS